MRYLTLASILLAVAARAWLHFSTSLVPGMNGGYYLVQARSLIEKFSLAIPDLPLTFALHACLATVIGWCSPLNVNESVMLAVKLADSVLPALAIIPVMLLGIAWAKGDKLDYILIALAAVLVPAGAPALSMVGDFEKNSLGLALLCTLAWALHRWVAEHTPQRLLVAVLLLGLLGITHIGVFGATLIFAASTLLALAVAQGREGMMRVAKLALFAAPVVIIAASLVFWKFDPSRIQKLIHAFSEPSNYLSVGSGPMGRGGPMMGPPGMNGTGWMRYAPTLAFALAVLPALTLVWWKRRSIGLPNLAIITGAAVTVLALTGPWVQGDKLMRFQLNATPLALLCLLFALLQIPQRWVRGLVGGVILAIAILPSIEKLSGSPRLNISEQAQAELQQLASSVEDPVHTLVVARHGLEWWTAWTLHTHIAQAQALSSDDWTKYKHVWFIEEKRGMNQPFGPGDGGGRGGPLSFFTGLFGFGGPPAAGSARGPELRRPGREASGNGPPFAMPLPGGNRSGPGGRGGPGGMMGASIPDDAEVLHDGEFFKLAWVHEAPAFVLERERDPFSDPGGFGF